MQPEGVRSDDDAVLGTYLHGVFDQPELLAELLKWAGLDQQQAFDYPEFRDQQINRLADAVEEVMPVSVLLNLLELDETVICMTIALSVLIALVLDYFFKEPKRFHPLVGFGNWVSVCRKEH